MFRLSVFVLALMSAGCVSLDPTYQRPAAPVPATLPGAHGEATAVVSQWQQVMNDARLKGVVTMALNSNRDLQKRLPILTPRAPVRRNAIVPVPDGGRGAEPHPQPHAGKRCRDQR